MPQWLSAKTPEDGLERRLQLKQLGLQEPHECSQRQRANLIEDRIVHDFVVFCSRHVWGEFDFEGSEIDEELDKQLAQNRKCRLFYRYEPGYSPIEHKELRRERDTLIVVAFTGLAGAVIGAAAAIITGLIAGTK